MRRLVVSLLLFSGLLAIPASVGAQASPGCVFALGFATLHDLLPATVGDCVDDEQHNPANGDALQHTTSGLFFWRQADNVTAFTDGHRSWVHGPDGVQERLNAERFGWEANPDMLPIVQGRTPMTTETTGVEGVVTLGPTTPVCRQGVPCSRPLAATVAIRDGAGRAVRQFTSGTDGSFRVELPPGTYTLVPAPLRPGSPFPRPIQTTVTVTPGSYAHADVAYDTGIR